VITAPRYNGYNSAEEAREIIVFPSPRPPVARESLFAAIKFFRVNATASSGIPLIRHNGMQHFVIKHILEEPARDPRLIKQRVNPNNSILLLDRTENEIFPGPLPAAAAPNDSITAKLPAKMSFLYSLENSTQIETFPFMLKMEMSLHGQRGPREFSFWFFPCHRESP
jgi:hypothetical protein